MPPPPKRNPAKPLSKNQWYWERPQQKAFTEVKEDFSKSPITALFGQETTAVSADASSYSWVIVCNPYFRHLLSLVLCPDHYWNVEKGSGNTLYTPISTRNLISHAPCTNACMIFIEGVCSTMACVIGQSVYINVFLTTKVQIRETPLSNIHAVKMQHTVAKAYCSWLVGWQMHLFQKWNYLPCFSNNFQLDPNSFS